jgi:hypothetical protein
MLQRLLLPLLCAVVGYVAYFPLTDTDIWWHLAAGRLIVERGQLLRVDPFALDTNSASWIDVHWLFQVLVYLGYRAGGALALVIGKCALVGVGAWALLRAAVVASAPSPEHSTSPGAPSLPQPLLLLLIALPVYLARYLVLARPVVLTLLFVAVYLLLLERQRRGARLRELWLLLPLQVLWANVQGLYLLGPAIVACTLIGETLSALVARRFAGFTAPRPRVLGALALLLGGLLVVNLATPYGWSALRLPFTLLSRIDPLAGDLFTYNISENIPPWVLERTELGAIGYFKWIAAASFASFLLAWRHVSISRLLIVSMMFALSLLASRNVLLLCWVGGWALASNLGVAIDGWRGRLAVARRALPAVGVLGLATLSLLAASGSRDDVPTSELAPFRVPVEAAERLRELRLEGRLFNSVRYGGYIAWALWPQHRPFIDGRLVLRSAAQFAEHLRLLDEPARFEAFRRVHDLRLALLPTAAADERYLPLVAQLYRDPSWRLLYTDGTQALFARADLPGAAAAPRVDLAARVTTQRIITDLERRYARWPAVLERAQLHLGRLLAEVGQLDRAAEVLVGHESAGAQRLLARVHYLAGRRAAARLVAGALAAREPDDADNLNLLALLALDEGEWEKAIAWARRALRADPYNRQTRLILERLKREASR